MTCCNQSHTLTANMRRKRYSMLEVKHHRARALDRPSISLSQSTCLNDCESFAFPLSLSTDFSDSTALYFDKCHECSPMLHRSRYMASLRSGPASRPPLFLQYAIIATSANIDDDHKSLATSLYQQARMFAEADEVKVGFMSHSFTNSCCPLLTC